ncbi:MAG: AbgT family transporter [Planctomycetota bacterium]
MSDSSNGGSTEGRKIGGPLDLIELIGNKLPDPAVLFLLGSLLVVVASHFAAPSLPAGFEVRWSDVGNRAGGVDEHLGTVGKVVVDNEGNETFVPGAFEVIERGDQLAAQLVLEDGQVVLDEAGEPIDFSTRGWAVFQKRPAEVTNPETGETELVLEPTGSVMFARSLMTSEGLYWILSSMEANFLGFAPLGVVLLGMLGIGPMERVGLIGAILRVSLKVVPNQLLTPAMVFLGVMSSLGSDAGYVVLPPLAAAAYLAAGRSPLAGIAAVFAGVSAGFNANLLITSLEPLMAELTQGAAQQVDAERQVAATSSWYFMAASTFLVTFVGWATTAVFVEKRLMKKSPDDGGPDLARASEMAGQDKLSPAEVKGLIASLAVGLVGFGLILTLVFWEGSPLHGVDGIFPRWVAVIVPLMFMITVVPAMVYGAITGVVKDTKDAAKTMVEAMANMAPIIVLAFFAGQFVAYFGECNLGAMLAFTGGEWLFEQRLPTALLIVAFIVVTMIFNLFVGSMSAKYALFAPIFVPMFMLIGIRPELTMVAYRIGDSATNIITPLNAYLVIVLVFMQRYAPKAGMGTLVAMMLPYSIIFGIVWSLFLVLWEAMGIPLGPGDLGTAFTDASTTP